MNKRFDTIEDAKAGSGCPRYKGEKTAVGIKVETEGGHWYRLTILTAISLAGKLYWLTPDEQERLHEQW